MVEHFFPVGESLVRRGWWCLCVLLTAGTGMYIQSLDGSGANAVPPLAKAAWWVVAIIVWFSLYQCGYRVAAAVTWSWSRSLRARAESAEKERDAAADEIQQLEARALAAEESRNDALAKMAIMASHPPQIILGGEGGHGSPGGGGGGGGAAAYGGIGGRGGDSNTGAPSDWEQKATDAQRATEKETERRIAAELGRESAVAALEQASPYTSWARTLIRRELETPHRLIRCTVEVVTWRLDATNSFFEVMIGVTYSGTLQIELGPVPSSHLIWDGHEFPDALEVRFPREFPVVAEGPMANRMRVLLRQSVRDERRVQMVNYTGGSYEITHDFRIPVRLREPFGERVQLWEGTLSLPPIEDFSAPATPQSDSHTSEGQP